MTLTKSDAAETPPLPFLGGKTHTALVKKIKMTKQPIPSETNASRTNPQIQRDDNPGFFLECCENANCALQIVISAIRNDQSEWGIHISDLMCLGSKFITILKTYYNQLN